MRKDEKVSKKQTILDILWERDILRRNQFFVSR